MQDTVTRIIPKRVTQSYRSHKIVVTFLPDTNEWRWSLSHSSRTTFSNVAKTQAAAFVDARRLIDQLEGA